METDDIKNSEFEAKIKSLKPDVIVMASFGKIIQDSFLNIAPHGVLNIHPSLLPKYRGPSPIQTVILNGDSETGVTIILTDNKMDHGFIVRHSVFNIGLKIKYKELHNELAELGASLICEVIPNWISGKIKADPQDESEATYTKKITKEDGLINWNEPAEIIERKTRAYEIWPTTYFFIKKGGKILRAQLIRAEILSQVGQKLNIGDFFEINGDLAVQTKNGIIKLIIVKPEGKKEMSGKDFLKGYKKWVNLDR